MLQFPQVWDGYGCEKACSRDHPMLYVHALSSNTWALRQSKCATFEAPFMFLLVGRERALLIDTGDVDNDGELVSCLRTLTQKKPLIVAHTHRHTDHVKGDDLILRTIPSSSLLEQAPVAGIELGDRLVEVIEAGSGHSAHDVCFLDVSTRTLFTGDVLYPGYLYIRSIER